MNLFKSFSIHLLFFIVLLLIYNFVIYDVFFYMGYFQNDFSILKLGFGVCMVFVGSSMYTFSKGELYKITIGALLFFSFIPHIAYYCFNDVNMLLLTIFLIPIILIFSLSLITYKRVLKRKPLELSNKSLLSILFLIGIFMTPYLLRIDEINWRNLLLDDIYISRENANVSVLEGYLANPLSKIILPIITIISIDMKKKWISILAVSSILLIFLTTGAQKDMLIGILLILFCYYITKKNGPNFVMPSLFLGTSILMIFSIFTYIFNNTLLITNYARRLFFIGPAINTQYFDYFMLNNFTEYNHTRIGSYLEGGERLHLTRWAGEEIIGNGTNANIGILMEGFVSYGFVGIIISSILLSLITLFFHFMNMKTIYYGIWISTIYIINFSLFDILLVTHGLIVFIVLAYLLIPIRESEYNLKEIKI